MDSIVAIAVGLAVRIILDTVANDDQRLTGTLVGIWEGVVVLHFLKKSPRSTDPYIAYAVRLVVDFLRTDSLSRTILVIIWTGMGMVLADISPAIWNDVGLQRVWRRLRREFRHLTRMIPTVAFFPPTRTVRFSPSRQPSVILEEPEPQEDLDADPPRSIVSSATAQSASSEGASTATNTPTAPPFVPIPPARDALRRRLPGYYAPTDYSDTETEVSVRSSRSRRGRLAEDMSETTSEGTAEDTATPFSTTSLPLDTDNIPTIEAEVEVEETHERTPQNATVALPAEKPEDPQSTPRQDRPIALPPTPSESGRHMPLHRDLAEYPNPSAITLPQIPDEEAVSAGGATSDGWDKIEKAEAEDRPPTPPEKDRPDAKGKRRATEEDMEDWNQVTQSQLLDPSAPVSVPTNDDQPPAYSTFNVPEAEGHNDNEDDMYWGDEGPPTKKDIIIPSGVEPQFEDGFTNAEREAEEKRKREEQEAAEAEEHPRIAGEAEAEAARIAKEAEEAEKQRKEEAKAERKRKKEEKKAEEARLKAEEEDRVRKEQEEEGRKAKEAEAEKQRKKEEKAARKKKEADDEAARRRKMEEERERAEAQEAEERRIALEQAEAEKQRLEEERLAAEAKRAEEDRLAEEAKRAEEAEAARLDAEINQIEAEEAERRAAEEAAPADAATAPVDAAEQDPLSAPPLGLSISANGVTNTFGDALAESEALRQQRIREAEEAEHRREELRQEAAAFEAQRAEERNRQKDSPTSKPKKKHSLGMAFEQQLEADQKAQEDKGPAFSCGTDWNAVPTTDLAADTASNLHLFGGSAEWGFNFNAGGAPDASLSGKAQTADPQTGSLIDFEDPAPAIPAPQTNSEQPSEEPRIFVSEDLWGVPPAAPDSSLPASTDAPEATEGLENSADANKAEGPTADDATQRQMEEETVSSENNVNQPSTVTDRVHRMLLSRAQLSQIQKQIGELPEGAPERAPLEKVERKYMRQLSRWYTAGTHALTFLIDIIMFSDNVLRFSGIAMAGFLDPFKVADDGTILMDNKHPKQVETVIEEKIEQALSPTAKSLCFTHQLPRKAKEQKTNVIELLDAYCLSDYTHENTVNKKKILTIDVPEEEFDAWISAYRVRWTQDDEE